MGIGDASYRHAVDSCHLYVNNACFRLLGAKIAGACCSDACSSVYYHINIACFSLLEQSLLVHEAAELKLVLSKACWNTLLELTKSMLPMGCKGHADNAWLLSVQMLWAIQTSVRVA